MFVQAPKTLIDDFKTQYSLDNMDVAILEGYLSLNGSAVTIDVPARLVSDHTMIPVRATAEAFGATVEWNDDSKTVTITE